jgi:hypothetical protein
MTSNTPSIPYSTTKPPSWLRRRWPWLVTLLVVLVAGFYVYSSWQDWSHRVGWWYWGRRCMAHVTPPGTPLVVSDPKQMSAILASNPDYVMAGWIRTTAIYRPVKLREFCIHDSAVTRDFAPNYAASGGVVVFLGDRTSQSGHRQLVLISLNVGSMGMGYLLPGWYLHGIASRDISLFGHVPRSNKAYVGSRWAVMPSKKGNAVVQPGIPDPQDLSHVTIPFTVPWHSGQGLIDAWLLNDGAIWMQAHDATTWEILDAYRREIGVGW